MNKIFLALILTFTAGGAHAELFTYHTHPTLPAYFFGSITVDDNSMQITSSTLRDNIFLGITYDIITPTDPGEWIELRSSQPWVTGDIFVTFDLTGASLGASWVNVMGEEQIDMHVHIRELGSFGNAYHNSGRQAFVLTSGASEVPVPAAGWLFMSALIGLAGKKQLSRR
jgi:hypothetical protein